MLSEEASPAMCKDCEVDYDSDGDMKEFQKAFLMGELSGPPPSARERFAKNSAYSSEF